MYYENRACPNLFFASDRTALGFADDNLDAPSKFGGNLAVVCHGTCCPNSITADGSVRI